MSTQSDDKSRHEPDADKQASAQPLRDEVMQWRGMKATKAGGCRITLIDAIVVGDEMEKALIEETARRRRAEILLAATQQAYVRDHEELVAPSSDTPAMAEPPSIEAHSGELQSGSWGWNRRSGEWVIAEDAHDLRNELIEARRFIRHVAARLGCGPDDSVADKLDAALLAPSATTPRTEPRK